MKCIERLQAALLLFLATSTLAPAQTDTTTFRAEEVSYQNAADSVKLAGTLTIPVQPGVKRFPVALLITGSGPEDRDETIFGHKPFKVIAEYLSARGFAVLRVDDRGVGQSSAGRNPKGATSANFAGDVRAGIAYLKTRPDVDARRIGLIGHSEGGMIAPMVAAAAPEDVAFIVSLAGTGVPGGVILKTQQRANLRTTLNDSLLIERYFAAWLDPFVDALAQTSDSARLRNTIREGFAKLHSTLNEADARRLGVTPQMSAFYARQFERGFNSEWMRYFVAHDPATDWRRVKCPVLALNGMKDVQVDVELNLSAIETALKSGGNRRYKIARLPGHNHLFQHAQTGSGAEYARLKEDFSHETLDRIADWLRQTVRD